MNNLSQNPNPKILQTEAEEEDEEELGLRAVRLANAVAFPLILKAALELGVIDAMHVAGGGEFLSPSEIAHRLPTTKPISNPEAPMLLDRLLRHLVSYSILKCRTVRTGGEVERFYGTEPICRFLLKENEELGSVAPLCVFSQGEFQIRTWNRLKDAIIEGGDAFMEANGVRVFEYMSNDIESSKLFNRAMSQMTTLVMKKVLKVYKGFEGVNTLVDVGGGIGTALNFIITQHPHIKGINFDLPEVVANAPSLSGVKHVGGDMFADIPKADTVFLKWILHNWTDEDCLKILKNCWKALPDKSKMIIVDIVIPTEPRSGDVYSNIVFDIDMTMLSQFSGAKERTQSEFEALATNSGFTRCEFICRAYHFWIIEFHK